VKHPRIPWKGVKLEKIKTNTPYAKYNSREEWPNTKFIKENTGIWKHSFKNLPTLEFSMSN
jgi:hypothetical protein